MFGNCLLETTLECYPTWLALTSLDKQLGLLPCPTDGNETCIVYFSNSSSNSSNNRSSSTSTPNIPCTDEMWAMSLDESETHNGSRTKCISVIRNDMKCVISSCLKFECTNNNAEYESIMLNIQRTISKTKQIFLRTYHGLEMANLDANYTPQQHIFGHLTEHHQDGSAWVDDDLSTHYS